MQSAALALAEEVQCLQRALFRCGICPVVACALREMGGQVSVCERVLQTVVSFYANGVKLELELS